MVFISTYANPLSTIAATGITCATILYQSNSKTVDEIKAEVFGPKEDRVEVKADIVKIKEDIAGTKKELKVDIDGVKKELSQVELRLTTNNQYNQGISLGSAYATMKCLSGKKQMKSQWVGDIAKGARFDGEDCTLAKATGEANKG